MVRRIKFALLTSFLFFLTLAAWSISSPIGSGNDTDYHLGSIWCARGESKGLCESIDLAAQPDPTAVVPFMFQMCNGRDVFFWPECEISWEKPATQQIRIAVSSKQSVYYWTQHIFSTTSVNQSVILIRIFNAIIASLVFFAMLALSSDRLRKAVVISWTLTLIPNGIQLLTGVSPRSWAVLGIMSSWAFLQAFLTESGPSRQKRLWQLASFVGSIALTASARFDALLFVLFTSTIVLGAHFIDFKNLSFKRIMRMGGILVVAVFMMRLIPRLNSVLSFRVPKPFNTVQYLAFQIEHIPEFVADWWGYRIGQQGNGPGIVGLVGVILFAIYMYASLHHPDKRQLFVTATLSVFICLALFRATTTVMSIVPLSGVYTFGLGAPLIGLSLLFSNNENRRPYEKGLIRTTLVGVSFVHTLTFFHWIEFFTQRGVKTGFFYRFSLNGSWWWDTWVSPNFVFIVGAAMFPIFLTFAWRSIPLDLEESLEPR